MSVTKQFDIFLDIKRATTNETIEVVEGDNGNYFKIHLSDESVPIDLTNCYVVVVFSTSDGTAEQDTRDTSDGDYVFNYDGENWRYENEPISLEEYGINLVGTPVEFDTITVTVFESIPTVTTTVPESTVEVSSTEFISKLASVHVEDNIVNVRLKNGAFSPVGLTECEIQVYSGYNERTLVTSAKFNFNARRAIINSDTIQAEERFPILQQLIATVRELVTTISSKIEALIKWERATASAERTEDVVDVVIDEIDNAKNFHFYIPSDVHIGESEPTGQQSVWIDPEGGLPDSLMTEGDYVGASATKSVHNADNLGSHLPSYYAVAQDLIDEIASREFAERALAEDIDDITELKFSNVTSSAYESNTHASDTDGEFPRRFTLTASGVTSSMLASVVFGVADVMSGEVSPICECGTNVVYVWTTTAKSSVTALSVIVHR